MDIFTYVEKHVGRQAAIEIVPGMIVSGILEIHGDVASGARIRGDRDATLYVIDSRSRVVD